MNIANVISQRAAENPRQIALIAPKNSWLNFIKSYQKKYDFLTFDELEKRSGTYANTLIELGFKKGMKSLVFITPGVDFSPVIFALFRMGVVPVLIDPGMGVDSLVHCIEEVKAQALVGIPKIHFLKKN